MADTPDLSRIVNLIMENPTLIEQISSLAKNDTPPEVKPEEPKAEERIEEAVTAAAVPKENDRQRINRHELLSAMKPYLSENRRNAIDSMESIVGIIDMMRRT